MSLKIKKFAVFVFILVFAAILLGACTLSGANEPQLTPFVPDDSGQPQDVPSATPEPTDVPVVDLFGTQTAVATMATLESVETLEPTEEPTEDGSDATEEPTDEPGTDVTPEPTDAAPTEQPGDTAQCPATHTVVAGENLFRIALKYNLNYKDLAAANGITNPDALAVDTVLKIPGCGGEDQADTGDTTGEKTHTVAAGETLYRIALKYGITWQELATFNEIENPNTLAIGQVLRIPGE